MKEMEENNSDTYLGPYFYGVMDGLAIAEIKEEPFMVNNSYLDFFFKKSNAGEFYPYKITMVNYDNTYSILQFVELN